MSLRRKRKQDAAYDGWTEREAFLEEFLSLSPGVSLSQQSAIEWSSSDEENENKSSKTVVVPGIRVINFSKKLQSSAFHNKMEWRKTERSKAEPMKETSDGVVSCQVKSSEPSEGLTLDSQRLELCTSETNGLPTPAQQNMNSDNIYPRVSSSYHCSNKDNGETSFHAVSFKTPKKERETNNIPHDGDYASPIIGSQRSRRTVKEHMLRDGLGDIGATEPSSPILGSQTIMRKQRNVFKLMHERNSSFGFAFEKLKGDTGISESCRNIAGSEAQTPATEIMNENEDPLKSKIRRRNLSYAFSQLEYQGSKSNEENNEDKRDLSNMKNQISCGYTQPLKKNTNSFIKKNTDTNMDVTSQSSKANKNEESTFWNLTKNSQSLKVSETTSRFSAFKDFLLKHERETCGDDLLIEESTSQNDDVSGEVADSQSDVDIDSIPSPSKEASDSLGKSLESYEASISSGSVPSSAPVTNKQEGKLMTGSHWIKMLQQQTPEKPSSKEKTEGGVESAKKKSKKHQLDLPSHNMPVLFTSYFIMQQNQHIKSEEHNMNEVSILENNVSSEGSNKTLTAFPSKSGMKKKIILTTWTCLCSRDGTVLPSMCDAQQHMAQLQYVPKVNSNLSPLHPGFTIVNDTPEERDLQNEVHPAWTILEAIEKCGGVSDVPVTITIRVHRIITRRKSADVVKEWELVGQDAAGVFCTVKIPNCPLASQLTELLERGEGSTHTVTQVTIQQRLTNTQNPSLFSLISSLHKAYQTEVRSDPLLYPLLHAQASRPSQTYCYVFTVQLGLTELLHSGNEVVMPILLPHWSLNETLQVACDGQRGSLSLHILYKLFSFLYVVNKSIKTENNDDSITIHENKELSNSDNIKYDFDKERLLVKKIVVSDGTTLPAWIPESGTVMKSALLKDVVICNGCVMMDEYSLLQQQETSMMLSLSALHKIIKPLSFQTQRYDLSLISGNILRVDEETAYTWPTCGKCKSDNIQDKQNDTVDCLACGEKSSIPGTGYCLEVFLNCGLELHLAGVKVKLYQRTIEKLLLDINDIHGEYDAASLVDKHVGPMVCVLQEINRAKRTSSQTYTLIELPY
ncbi:uncharacterized protein [Cherax quadricarinatus]|uniref:uncharacterized protein isoform X3 n=1 Tax=Cherax quadricarinatus TaxID=27406 RepID=UPI002378F4AF|nr:uncharacterized protein LOC128684570 isoform X3 [Cherax quadricarinatus]